MFALAGTVLAALSSVGYEVTMTAGESPVAVRDAIRAARKAGKIAPDEPVTVTLKPGIYTFDGKFLLGAEDSGTAKAPVVWRAEKRGSARLFGGRAIPRAAFRPVADAAVLRRLAADVRGKVLACDAAPYLVGDTPKWPDHIRGVMPGPWLYCGGEPQTLARWPNASADGGWFGYTNLVEAGSAQKPGAFEFPGRRAERWDLTQGVWLLGYWHHDWYCDTLRLASYDAATHVARLAAGSTYALGPGGSWPFPVRRFRALNLLEELDAPGEWYLDRKAKRLYWYPPESGGDGEIVLAQKLTPLVRVVKAHDITFENLAFEYSHGDGAVVLEETVRCVVRNCDLSNHSGTPVTMGGRENRVVDSSIRNCGATAVNVSGGNPATLLPANNALCHCTIENYAMFQRTMAPGIALSGCGNAVRACTVRNAPYIALWYHGTEHLIAENEFDHVVLEAGDSGCIYSGYNAAWLGTLIFGNYIHDLAKTDLEANARNGIYFDDCDWGDDVIGNVFRHAGRAIFFGGGKLHGAYNNLVDACYVGVHCDSRGRSWRTGWRGAFGWDRQGRSFARYRLAEAGAHPHEAPWHVVYPALEEALDNRPELPGMNTVSNNVFSNCKTVFGYDAGAQLVMGKASPGNRVVPAGEKPPLAAPQPIRLTDAKEGVFASGDGATVLRVALDVSARLSWSLARNGRTVIEDSPLGVTVGYVDYGRRIVPGAAEEITGAGVDAKPFSKMTCEDARAPNRFYRNAVTNLGAVAGIRGGRMPLRDLITGGTTAFLEVRVWNGGGALRWIVPGAGTRKVYGENMCFIGDTAEFTIGEWERPNGYPEFMTYSRGTARSVSFPEYPRGWMHDGTLVTPWRGVVVSSAVR